MNNITKILFILFVIYVVVKIILPISNQCLNTLKKPIEGMSNRINDKKMARERENIYLFSVDDTNEEYDPKKDLRIENRDSDKRIHMLASNVAYYGKDKLKYKGQPPEPIYDLSKISTDMGKFTGKVNNPDDIKVFPRESESTYAVKYTCRPSTTGVFIDCGPLGANIGCYGNRLEGCDCPPSTL